MFRREAQHPQDAQVEAFLGEQKGHFVDGLHVLGGDDRLFVDVTKQRDLRLELARKTTVGAAQEDVRLDTDGPELTDAVLGRFGLLLAGGVYVGHQSQMDEQRPTCDLRPVGTGGLLPERADSRYRRPCRRSRR